jgi:hypothetical protein
MARQVTFTFPSLLRFLRYYAVNTGYPSPDAAVRDWFRAPGMTSPESDIRFSAFLVALFEKIDKVISEPESCIRRRIAESPVLTDQEKTAALKDYPESFAGQFRLLMTVGQKFLAQGPLRTKFYADVMERAEEASSLLYVASILLKITLAVRKTAADPDIAENAQREVLGERTGWYVTWCFRF